MASTNVITAPGFLDRERTVARAGYNRWLVPPCALAIHLCIGMAYGFSVFWIPLSKAIGITKSVACPKDASIFYYLTTTSCDWKIAMLQTWIYGLFFVFLGFSAALWGGWLERVGPRKAGVVAAFCWCGGMLIMALGVAQHQLWLVWLGAAVGGIGLGLGYISPVSTLIKWFPDRRGMATGMAIMGFGGGAMIGAPLADRFMKHFATSTSVGVVETLIVLAAIYFVFMISGALGYRLPALNWKPLGWNPDAVRKPLVTRGQVHLNVAWRTPQFWLVWAVLTLNVGAGIGILSMASPILQEVFGGRLIGMNATFEQLNASQLASIAALAAGFTGLLSLFNIAGRIFWASLSDRIGRKTT
jgi:MFS family permease